MSEPTVLTTPINTDMAWAIAAKDTDGNAVAFSASDTLEAIAWQGSDSGTLFAPTATWTSAPAGTARLAVGHAQTASLSPGVYPLEVTAILFGTTTRIRILDAWLSLTTSPGTATLPPVYCTYQDLVNAGGGAWLELLRQREGLANFTRERAMARAWLDTLIVKKFRPWENSRAEGDANDSVAGPTEARSTTMVDYLADDALMVTDDITQITALKTLELICLSRMTFEKGDTFMSRAQFFRALCRNRVLCTTAEIDTDADGLADYAFHLGIVSTR